MEYIDNVYVINMEKDHVKLKKMLEQEKLIGKKITRISAINGQELEEKEIKESTSFFCNYFCSLSSIGCFMSHKKAWKTVLDNEDEYAIIMEDDAILVSGFNEKLKLVLDEIIQNETLFDFIYLGCLANCKKGEKNFIDKMYSIFLPNLKAISKNKHTFIPISPLGMHCYLLSKKAAKILLEISDKMSNNVDYHLLKNAYKLNIYATSENLGFQFASSSNSSQTTKFPYFLNKILDKINIDKGVTLGYYLNFPLVTLRRIGGLSTMILFLVLSFILFPIQYSFIIFLLYLY